MLGAIAGDIIGLSFQFRNRRTKDFGPLFGPSSKFTDDTVCTVAIGQALTDGLDPVATLQAWGRRYWDNGGWGQRFVMWLADDDPQPYGSYGNGAAMRVGPAGLLAGSLEEAITLSDHVTRITHYASDFEDAIRNAISLGGDSNTLAAMTGSVAEALFGMPESIAKEVWVRLPDEMRRVIQRLYAASAAVLTPREPGDLSPPTVPPSPI